MPEPEVGKCYRWTSNKQGIGKFLSKESVTKPMIGQYGEPMTETFTEVRYTFEKLDIGSYDIKNLEEYPCPPEGGGRIRKSRKNRNSRKSRKNIKSRKNRK